MKLMVSRSQKTGGMISSTVIFGLDARVELTPEEAADVRKYKLGKEVIYNSEAAKRHLDGVNAGLSQGGATGFMKGLASAAMAKLSLNITIDDLLNGQHVQAKDMNEMVGAEAAIVEACQTLRTYLNIASTFDGKADVREF